MQIYRSSKPSVFLRERSCLLFKQMTGQIFFIIEGGFVFFFTSVQTIISKNFLIPKNSSLKKSTLYWVDTRLGGLGSSPSWGTSNHPFSLTTWRTRHYVLSHYLRKKRLGPRSTEDSSRSFHHRTLAILESGSCQELYILLRRKWK